VSGTGVQNLNTSIANQNTSVICLHSGTTVHTGIEHFIAGVIKLNADVNFSHWH
jgi:hypothetical protein